VWSHWSGPLLACKDWHTQRNTTHTLLQSCVAHTRTFFMVSVPAAEDRSANSTNPVWPRTDRAREGTSFTILMLMHADTVDDL
jgi:hypothetical protein